MSTLDNDYDYEKILQTVRNRSISDLYETPDNEDVYSIRKFTGTIRCLNCMS